MGTRQRNSLWAIIMKIALKCCRLGRRASLLARLECPPAASRVGPCPVGRPRQRPPREAVSSRSDPWIRSRSRQRASSSRSSAEGRTAVQAVPAAAPYRKQAAYPTSKQVSSEQAVEALRIASTREISHQSRRSLLIKSRRRLRACTSHHPDPQVQQAAHRVQAAPASSASRVARHQLGHLRSQRDPMHLAVMERASVGHHYPPYWRRLRTRLRRCAWRCSIRVVTRAWRDPVLGIEWIPLKSWMEMISRLMASVGCRSAKQPSGVSAA